jgi:ABC-2 type transport system ATP-binding protein
MLSIQNIKAGYKGQEVLKGASLEIAPGTVQGILGMNGAGKTTFFESLYGRLPLMDGTRSFCGRPLAREDISFLETSNYFYPYTTGREHLLLCSQQNPQFDIEKWNALFRLPLKKLIATYSTGMKKKLALLGTLALARPVIIMDEPFNGMDMESSETLYQLIGQLRAKQHYILISSHIMETLTHTCDAISYLSGGMFSQTFQREDYPGMKAQLREKISVDIQGALDALDAEGF